MSGPNAGTAILATGRASSRLRGLPPTAGSASPSRARRPLAAPPRRGTTTGAQRPGASGRPGSRPRRRPLSRGLSRSAPAGSCTLAASCTRERAWPRGSSWHRRRPLARGGPLSPRSAPETSVGLQSSIGTILGKYR